ncbi:MAG: quinol:cytochrome C oxidoreductase [Cytophagaceae bacterium]
MTEEKFVFTSLAKKRVFTVIGLGIILLLLGMFMLANHIGVEHHEHTRIFPEDTHHDHAQFEHVEWSVRIIKNIWHNNIFFVGISIIGVFFIAFNYVAWAGWSAVLKRIPEAFGYFLPIGFVLTLLTFLIFNHDLFHWTHHGLTDPNDPHYDALIAGKSTYLNLGFFIFRMIAYFALWIIVWFMLRKFSLAEDIEGGFTYYNKSIVWSAIFLIIFGVTSSMAAWDWVMSMDPHFFSTMFGWYVLASWLISGLAVITLTTLYLKDAGYLPMVNSSHLHDLGKFMFAFSIFWTYIWFAQFLLIYYANIPEESVYFVERLKNDVYSPFFFGNLIINFFFPFLVLMTADAKRQALILKVVAVAILLGHWSDFYLMMTPGTLGPAGGFDFLFFFIELGMAMIYAGLFAFALMFGLAKASLVAKNHPMIEESIHHHVY